MTTGEVPGADARERSVRLAGALAELGVGRLVLERSGEAPRELFARDTDLPALLQSSLGCVLAAPEMRVEVEIRADRLVWRAGDHAAAMMLQAALAR